nr:acetamidase/formamidase family protein [Novibacillus thermophilus]
MECPIEARIRSIADLPNACCTLWLPTVIFDLMPSEKRLKQYVIGVKLPHSLRVYRVTGTNRPF